MNPLGQTGLTAVTFFTVVPFWHTIEILFGAVVEEAKREILFSIFLQTKLYFI